MEEKITKASLFGNLDFADVRNNPGFKEDSVREVIILPIIRALGYSENNIIRSKNLEHPFLRIGSKKRPITLVPDYTFKIGSSYAWVLDAKAPNQKIKDDDNVDQVYSYATHPEIRSTYFALCNGLEFSVFRTTDTNNPMLLFSVDEIEYHWDELKRLLSPSSFQIGKEIEYEKTTYAKSQFVEFDYKNRPLLEEIPVRKQAAKRHFGCNAYFTRQSWDIVSTYIKNYSKPGDIVLDPFGGSGVTAIEALMNNRKAIHIDINPLSIFIVDSLSCPVNLNELKRSFSEICLIYNKKKPETDDDVEKILNKYGYPKDITLPKGSDVDTVDKLFSTQQLAQLALLKYLIHDVKDTNIRKSLLLAFYNTISVINLTFHETPHGGGNHFGYYYRYRLAPDPAMKDLMNVFENKFDRIINGKKDIEYFINNNTISNLVVKHGSATNLSFISKETIDYIYTDPPYGKKIPYLDLSIIWNSWLDLPVTEQDYQLEAIEGGEHNKGKFEYNRLIEESIQEMYRVLKFDRWLSFVFAHKDPEFWHLIIDTAERCGFEYVGAVPQKNGQTSFKKRQNPFTVLSGQLIINFRKVKNPKAVLKANLGLDIAEIVIQTIEGVIAKNDGATLEQINDELIIKGLELGFLDLLKKEYSDLTPILLENFDFEASTEKFKLHKDTKFKSHIDVKLRIKYYLISYLRRMERTNQVPHFDEIILNILPLLKNGTTPEHQTVLTVLEDIAERVGEDGWRLKRDNPTLFD